jgi:hypothetical protein
MSILGLGRLGDSDEGPQPVGKIDTVARRWHDRTVILSARVPHGPSSRHAPTVPPTALPYRIQRHLSSPSVRSKAHFSCTWCRIRCFGMMGGERVRAGIVAVEGKP